MASRAEQERVPDDVLSVFLSKDETKDAEAFMELLHEWYLDRQGGYWYANWKEFSFPALDLNSAVLQGAFNLQGARFVGPALFKRALIKCDANLRFCMFGAEVHFDRAEIQGDIHGEGARFQGNATFLGATVENAYLRRARFAENSDFRQLRITGDLNLRNCRFARDLLLDQSQVHRKLSLRSARLHHRLLMSRVQLGRMDVRGITVQRGANFAEIKIQEDCEFRSATIFKGATFVGSSFLGNARLDRSTFRGGTVSFSDATFHSNATFAYTRFLGHLVFHRTLFSGDVRFDRAEFHGAVSMLGSSVQGGMTLDRTVIGGPMTLGLSQDPGALIRINEVGSIPPNKATRKPTGAAELHFGPMSLKRTIIRNLDARNFRFHAATEIEQLTILDCNWPTTQYGYSIGDEGDLLDSKRSVTADEVERIYRSLRRNHEERGNLVGAHRWYFAEMEIGRTSAQRTSLKRFARNFYLATSRYGLLALRPFIVLILSILIAWVALTIPNEHVCAIVVSGQPPKPACAGWEPVTRVVLSAASFQSQPPDVRLPGVGAQVAWILA